MSGSVASNVPAVIDTEDGLDILPKNALNPLQAAPTMWCSFVPKTDLDRANMLVAFQGQQPKLSSVINTTIRVSDVGRHMVTLVNRKTGEVNDCVRTILFCVDGKSFACVSEGISKSLGMIFAQWKPPPWSPPLPLIVRQLELDEGRRWYLLELDREHLNSKGMLGK